MKNKMKTSASITLQYDSIFSPFTAQQFNSALDWLNDCEFDGAELIISKPDDVNRDALCDALEKRNLLVSTIATGQSLGMEGLSLTSTNPDIRKETIKRLCQHMDLSNVLPGRPNITIGLLRGKGSGNLQQDLDILTQALSQVVDYAKTLDIVINLEPINRYETSLLNSNADTVSFLESIGNPENVGILYDTFHSNIEDADIIETVRSIVNRISHVHLADSNRRLPGEGHFDFRTLINELQIGGYSGFVSLETMPLPNAEAIIEGAKRSVQTIFESVEGAS